ncbi:MAG: S8 family serine peptidase [Candidatus Neomarinimicrobiota bacterium]
MRTRTTNSKGTLFAVFMSVFFSWVALSAQEMIGGKQVRTGIWEGRQVEYLEGEIAIILKPRVSQANVLPLLQSHGTTIKRDFDKLGWGLIELPEAVDALSLAAELKRNPMIEAAEPNMVDRLNFEPNDTYYQDNHQWALKNNGRRPRDGTPDADIDAPEAWEITRGSSSIIIAILDTGIPMVNGSLSHPDLNDAGKFILGADYAGDGEGVRDNNGHGTHVTGIASAETDNGTGIAGVAGNCRVMVIQVFDSSGIGRHSWFRSGVIYAVDNGADVINYSGGGDSSSTQTQGVQYAYNNGVILVTGSGNDNSSVIWPAAYSTSYSNVIAVGATDHNDVRSSYSNYGSQLTVVAPGGYGYPWDENDIYSTTPNYDFTSEASGATRNYGYMAGTSMAAPHVSGLAGLILSMDSTLTPSQVRSTIEETADDKGATGRDNYYGWGRVNAYNAAQSICSSAFTSDPYDLEISTPDPHIRSPILSWSHNGQPAWVKYRVWRKDGAGSNWWVAYRDLTQTTKTDYDVWTTGWPGETITFYYEVQAYVPCYESGNSNTESIVGGYWHWPPKMMAEDSNILPKSYALYSAHPNPFNPATTIGYDLPEASRVSLVIYDIAGREVYTHAAAEDAGYRQIVWNGADRGGRQAPAGVYIYRLVAASMESSQRFTASRKMVLMK